ncbi:acyl-CoA dehydrogenase family protein [Rhabdothermincola sediminis]|uniref:acyl-CoA dehydrogenase family protein n=1 Tax=Rhabdothermincola sediminis TaxID=2751370 RepID=UPI001AA07479|nr:acyl-CoA dehydrogenase family protein [Rhabdothermincola sediminis]
MDLAPTPEQQAFRAECRTWLQANLPWEYGKGLPPHFDDLAEEVTFLRGWQRRLAEGRWVGVTWPERYGGRGAGPLHHYIVQEELARARAPELVGRIGVNLVGPTLLAHGTAAQRERWLPKILDASELFCQLFSEPGAGSDLAALATRAERVEGGWRINGQKVWTSYAQFADWGLLLARTDPTAPKHQGISAFVIDMHQPGVEVRPLRQITDEYDFNEVFFTDAFVPEENLIGAENEGWRVSSSTLTHERGTNPRQLVIHAQLLEELLRLALEQGRFDDPRLQQRLAEAYVEVRLFQLHNWRSLSRLEHGRELGPEGSALKLYWSEMSKRLHDTAMAVLADAAPLWWGASGNPGGGRWQRSWLYYHAASVFAGTNEIQRTIIGERVLGLPREPRQETATR